MQLETWSREGEGHQSRSSWARARAQPSVGTRSVFAVGAGKTWSPPGSRQKPGGECGGGGRPSCLLTVRDLDSSSQQESREVSPETSRALPCTLGRISGDPGVTVTIVSLRNAVESLDEQK